MRILKQLTMIPRDEAFYMESKIISCLEVDLLVNNNKYWYANYELFSLNNL